MFLLKLFLISTFLKMGCTTSSFINQYSNSKFVRTSIKLNLETICKRYDCNIESLYYNKDLKKIQIFIANLTLEQTHDIFKLMRTELKQLYDIKDHEFEFIIKRTSLIHQRRKSGYIKVMV